MRLRALVSLFVSSPKMFGYLSVGQILRMVRVSDQNPTSLFELAAGARAL